MSDGWALVGLLSGSELQGCGGRHFFHLLREDLDVVLYCHCLEVFNQRLFD